MRALLDVPKQSAVVFREAAIGMALVDFDGRFVAVNPAFCRFVDRTEPDLLRRTWQSITHPDDVGTGEDELVNLLDGDADTFHLAKRYMLPNGRLVWALLSVKLMTDADGEPRCLLTQVVDYTDRRRTEEGLARLASIVESSDDAIISSDMEENVLTWNRGAERIYGYAPEEMIGRPLSIIVPPDRETEGRMLSDRALHNESVRNFETVRRRKDGTTVDVSLTVSPIVDMSGRPRGMSSIARDITEQKAITAALGRTLEALEGALAEARDSEARSRTFFSNAAHHLRNPVAGIRACMETLMRGTDSASHERLLTEAAREVSRLSQVVDRLLQLARLQRSDTVLITQEDIVDLCEAEVERARSLAPHLEVSLFSDGPLPLNVDATAISEIVRIVLENARRHARGRIDATVARGQNVVTVRIADDGPGLPAGREIDAFEPFVSLDAHGGLGLGLAVAQGLARAHGGDLVYEDGAFVLSLKD